MAIVDITLDVAKPQECIEKIEGRQGDTGTVVRATILNDGEPYDFTGRHAELALVRPDGWWVHLRTCVLQEGTTNVWTVELPVEATAYDGLCKLAYFVVRDDDDDEYRDSTQRFLIELDQSVTAEANLGPYSDQVDKLTRQAELILAAWDAQVKQQALEFQQAQEQRASAFAAQQQQQAEAFDQAQENRQTAFESAEQARADTFSANEQQRQATFETNEAARQEAVAEAVEDAQEAADMAANASQGLVGPAINDYFDEYGIPGFESITDAEIDALFDGSTPPSPLPEGYVEMTNDQIDDLFEE